MNALSESEGGSEVGQRQAKGLPLGLQPMEGVVGVADEFVVLGPQRLSRLPWNFVAAVGE